MSKLLPHHFYENHFELYRNSLIERYSEPHRHYHNIFHINDMLNLSAACHPISPGALNLMIWYHDAIYDPTRSDNEEKSAELAVDNLKDRLETEDVDYIANGILFTKHTFSSRYLSSDLAILIDCDLHILSHDFCYKMYARNIRKEYSHLSDEAYITGRIDFLEKMLNRNPWYSVFRNRNSRAQKNINMELQKLKTGELL